MPLYSRVAELPLVVDAYELEPLAPEAMRFDRTLVRLRGAGEEGLGEDVTYSRQSTETPLDLTGSYTLRSFSKALPEFADYRTWAFEAAALDLALRQNGLSLADAVGREPRPVRFVVSQSKVAEWRSHYPDLRFKLDATDAWTDEVVAELAATHAVGVVDLKGLYEGDWVDATPSADLYSRVADAFPDAWLEDPRLNDETGPALEPHRRRITWDFPIHSVADVETLPFPPACLNSKPSRFGTVQRLFDFYDHCEERGIAIYGGGQFELGPGRSQIQHLASLFHPDMPNDVAPGAFNAGEPRPGLPQSPLPAASREPGFR
ncbi:MAG: hypothetical protein H0V45_12765 [Actinobacteria bacterium]|nr:hypothetical protein [Actinomycetota bacterium]